MKIRVRVSNSVPTQHAQRILHPSVEIEDTVQPGETPMQAYRRISVMASAMFARETLDQLRFADRMSQGNEQWCDEYLSTVAEDHPAAVPIPSDVALPDHVVLALGKIGEIIGKSAIEAFEADKVPTPPQG